MTHSNISANEYLNKIMTTIMVSNIWILQLMIHNMENYIKQRIYLFMALFYVKQKTSNAQRIYYSHEMDPLHFFSFWKVHDHYVLLFSDAYLFSTSFNHIFVLEYWVFLWVGEMCVMTIYYFTWGALKVYMCVYKVIIMM